MKKQLLLLILLLFIVSCGQISKEEPKTLSELQVDACNAAHDAGTCDTRLVELGIVLKEDCCQILGKCCWRGVYYKEIINNDHISSTFFQYYLCTGLRSR